MRKQNTFDQVGKNHLILLGQYVPVVDRVHRKNHPEFHEVKALTEDILRKAGAAGKERPQLDKEFARLREVTRNYTVPEDVCESYEAVYTMLSELDKSYHT